MRITFDNHGHEPPQPGDVLVTSAGSAYTVIFARQARSRVYSDRWVLTVERGHGGGREVPFRWYPRGPKARVDA